MLSGSSSIVKILSPYSVKAIKQTVSSEASKLGIMAAIIAHPYQCVEVAVSIEGDYKFLLLAAKGQLFAVNIEDGSLRDTWQAGDKESKVQLRDISL